MIFFRQCKIDRDWGKREEQLEIARNFKNAGLDSESISSNTGLTMEEVEQL